MAKDQISKLEQISQILEGIKNNIIPDKTVNKIAKLRRQICRECQPKNFTYCETCGCLLRLKTKSPNAECPKNLWQKFGN